MSFPMVRRLDVWRRLEDGDRVPVGTLAQNRQGVFFQYADDYRSRFGNLSPFALALDSSLQKAPAAPHGGLHGVFADSLPDGWGLLLMDRVFRQAGVLPDQVTAMDRLAFVGERGAGALEYRPASEMGSPVDEGASSHAELGMNAQALFDGETTQLLAELVRAGSSGGARPKAQLYLPDDDSGLCSTAPVEGMRPYLVKFTSAQLALGHEEGLCEAAYLELARRAGIEVPNWRLISAPAASGAKAWLALERFDCTAAGGRLHLHSACGLLGADFRLPSLDYVDLVKASSMLCKSPAVGQEQFRRAVFNLFAMNQDDHSKNWAFLQNDKGDWRPAPFYDVTFSPGPYGEHATAYAGFGKAPPLKAMQALAAAANVSGWAQAQEVIREVVAAIGEWDELAQNFGVSFETRRMMSDRLNAVYAQNRGLL
jgi:serine/threonine-protein kinase HipA